MNSTHPAAAAAPRARTPDVSVMYLRRKTEAGGLPRLIHTERGAGYVLREPRAEREAAGEAASCA